MDFGDDLSCFPYEGKVAESFGSVICRALQFLFKKAVLQYGHASGCFWGDDKPGASGRSESSYKVKRSSSSRSYADAKSQISDTTKVVRRQHSKKTFSRAASWSRYLEAGVGNHDAVAVMNGNVPEKDMADLSELFLGQKFASGSHSRLYHGFYKRKAVAVKLMMPPSDDEALAARLHEQFSHEVALLSRLHHRNIVEFVSACKSPPVFCIITEYLPEGSLKSFLRKKEPYSLPMKLVVGIAMDIASAMNYLHSLGVIHRDLKSDNLLMTEDLRVKVADFGISCLEIHRDNRKGNTGTYRWMAPEMIKGKPCSRKVDVYSFSIVLWELLTCLTPYEEITPVQAAFAVSHQNARPRIPPNCPMNLAKLMEKCWSTTPSKRPEFAQIIKALEDLQVLT